MQRHHLFEIHDQSWCPDILRNELTLTLKDCWSFTVPQFIRDWVGVKEGYAVAGDVLMDTLWKTQGFLKEYTLVDICSGSGGPIPSLTEYIKTGYRTKCNYILTDLYPNVEQWKALENDLIAYEPSSVDAGHVPKRLASYVRTSFGSFHHLPEDVAQHIFKDVIEHRSGIMIFELSGRNFWSILGLALVTPIVGFFSVFRNFSLTRLILWASGVMPLILLIDGFLTNLRTYEKQDYERIVNSIPESSDFEWSYKTYPLIDIKSSPLGEFGIFRAISGIFEQILLLRVFTGMPKQHGSL